MSILREIQNQSPVVRTTLFALSTILAISVIAVMTFSSVQKDIYFATHQDEQARKDFLASREAAQPQPLASIARVAGGLVAGIGSLIGWDRSAGFDSVEQPSNTQDAVHLLPISE